MLRERERRVVRSRMMRRSAIVVSVAAAVAVVFLRGMSAPVPSATEPAGQHEAVADLSSARGDGGYSRD